MSALLHCIVAPPIARPYYAQKIPVQRSCTLPVAIMSSGLSFYAYETTALPSSSKARCLSPSPLPVESRVKLEIRTPQLNAYEAFAGRAGCMDYYQGELPSADTHSELHANGALTTSSSAFRHYRPHTLLPTTARPNPNTAALFSQQFIHPTHHPNQDVLPLLNASSFTNELSETAGQHGSSSSEQLPPPRAPLVSQHGSINSSSWTSSYPVFTTTSALAAHHGIPQSLPPVPRTTRYLSEKPKAVPTSSTTNSDLDFSNLVSDYLRMLSEKPEQQQPASSGSTMTDDNAAALQAVLDVIQGSPSASVLFEWWSDSTRIASAASPEYQQLQEYDLSSDMPGDYNSFLTSPMEESPYEDMLTTPALGSGDFDYLTSPAIVDADDFGYGADMPLFGGPAGYTPATVEPIKSAPPVLAVHHPVDFDGMYTMSPDTPALDPSSLQTSPLATPASPSLDLPASSSRRKNAPTGTRKNITPEALVPYDAPIQPRKYVTPSATSRKAVPAGFAKKRARSQAFDEDELADEASLDPADVDAIEAKRRQNTLAARRSRKRKLEYQRDLEASVERLNDEMLAWKSRAETLEAVLRSHGLEVPCPSF